MPQQSEIFPISSVQESGTSKIASTTAFDDDKAVVTAHQDGEMTLQQAYTAQGEAVKADDIAAFMAKPRVLQKGQFSTADTVSTFPRLLMPFNFLNSPIYKDKLRGYLGLRGKLVFTLQVNANRFQQGRYMLTWVPLGGVRSTVNGDNWAQAHSSTLTQRTQLPRVEIDLASDTAGQISIPYAAVQDFYPLASLVDVNHYGSWGILRIFPYHPLEAITGDTTCSYTLWAHLEDLELIGPATPQDVAPQSSIALRKKKKNATQFEADSQGVGPISSLAFKISKAAKFFSPVPMLSDFTGPLSWAADIVGNAASVFGWSAPSNLSPLTRMLTSRFQYATNLNKVDNSLPLSLDSANQVEVFPGFGGTVVDEMDIVHFSNIPFYNYFFVFPEGFVADTVLLSFQVSPMDSIKTRNVASIDLYDMGPCQYLTHKFSHWRGSMRYKLKFIKTEFHSGRLSIAFTPWEPKSYQQNLTISGMDYVLRDIIDIRDATEYEFIVPYISSAPYRPCNTSIQGSAIGQVQISIIDPLVAPSTVNSQIECYIEMSMCEDAEFFGVPNTSFTAPNIVQFQSDDTLVRKAIGNARLNGFQLETSKAAVGERVTNLRTLLKKFYPITSISIQPANKNVNIYPFSFSYLWSSAGVSTQVQVNDLYGEMCNFYAFSRGGVRLKAIIPNITTALVSMSSSQGNSQTRISDQSPVNQALSIVSMEQVLAKSNYAFFNNADSGIEVQVPQYHYMHSRANADCGAGNTAPYLTATGSTNPTYCVTITEAKNLSADRADISCSLLRSAADDTNFSSFISIPPLART